MKIPTSAPIVSAVSVIPNTTYDVALITLNYPNPEHPAHAIQQAFALPHPAALSLLQDLVSAIDQLRQHNAAAAQDQPH